MRTTKRTKTTNTDTVVCSNCGKPFHGLTPCYLRVTPKVVKLRSGGTVTLSLDNVSPLTISESDTAFIACLNDAMKAYESGSELVVRWR